MGQAPTIRTDRLVLRPLIMADHDGYLALVTSDRARFMGGPHPTDMAWRWLCNDIAHWSLEGFGGLAVTRDGGAMIGQVAVTRGPDMPEPQLGWFLLAGHEGHGLATEAARALRDHVIGARLVASLVSYVDADNAASAALAARLGAWRDADAATPHGMATDVWRHNVAAS